MRRSVVSLTAPVIVWAFFLTPLRAQAQITLLSSDTANGATTSFNGSEAAPEGWSNAQAPSPGNNYSVSNATANGFGNVIILRTPNVTGNQTFMGGSLTLGNNGDLRYKGTGTDTDIITINNLTINGGFIDNGQGSTFTVAGNGITLGSSGGTLETQGSGRGILVSANITGAGNTLTVDSGTVGGGTVNTAGIVILTGTNSYGNTVLSVNGGDTETLQIGGLATATPTAPGTGTATGSLGTGNVTTAAGTTLTFDLTTNYAFAGNITGAGALTIASGNTGIITLTGSGTNYTGATTISAGTSGGLVIGNGGTLGATAVAVNTGLFGVKPTTGSTVSATSLSLALGTTYDMSGDSNAGTFNLTGALGIASATMKFDLGVSGASTVTDKLTAAGAATLSGNTTIDIVGFGTGTLTSGSYNLITAASGLNAGGTFTLGTSSVVINGTTYGLSLSNSAGAETLVVSGGSSAISAIWTATGSGTFTWNSPTTNWSTSPNVPGSAGDTATFSTSAATNNQVVNLDQNRSVGTLIFSNTTASPGNYTIAGGAGPFTLTLDNGASAPVVTNSNGNNVISAPLALNGSATVTVNSGTSLSVSGGIASSTQGLTLTGGGTLILGGTDLETGGTQVQNGTLRLAGAGAFPTGPLTLGNAGSNGTFDLNGFNATATTLTVAGTTAASQLITNSNTSGNGLTSTFTFSGGAATTFNGTIQDGAGKVALATTGAGSLILGGTNAFSGGTTISAGTVQISSPSNIGSGGVMLAGTATGGATLAIAGSSPFTDSGTPIAITVANAAGTYNIDVSNSAGATLTGAITGGGTANPILAKTDTGSLTLSGTSSLATGTHFYVRGGTLTLSGSLTVNTATGTSVWSDVALQAGDAAIMNVTGSYTQVGTGAQDDFNLADNGGSGTLNVSGSGLVTIPDLFVGKGAGATGVVTQNAGQVTTSATQAGSILGTRLTNSATASGTYNLNGGTLTTGQISSGGGTATFNLNGGTLRANGASTTFLQGLTSATIGSSGGTIDANGLAIAIAQPLVAAAGSTGAGTVTIESTTTPAAGKLTLTGASTYANPTSVVSGTLALSGTGSLTSAVTVQSGATLAGSSGSTFALKNGLTLSSGAGSSFVLNDAAAGNLATAPIQITGAFTVNSNNSVALSFAAGNPSVPGTYSLYGYTAGSGPTSAANFNAPTGAPAGYAYSSLFVNAAQNQIDVTLTSSTAFTWLNLTGTGPFNWSTGANWFGGTAPSSLNTETLIFGSNATVNYVATIDSAHDPWTANALVLLNPAGVSGTILNSNVNGLNLAAASGGATITQFGQGAMTINSPIVLGANTTVTLGTQPIVGGVVTLGGTNGGISQGGSTAQTLTVTNTTAATTTALSSLQVALAGSNNFANGATAAAPISVVNTSNGAIAVLSLNNAAALGSSASNSALAPISMNSTAAAPQVNVSGTLVDAAVILQIGATIGTDPGGNNADFSYQIVTEGTTPTAGQINLGALSNSGNGTGFAALGGNRLVALYTPSSTTLATLVLKTQFGQGGGDHLAFGSPTANGTLTLLNPIDLNGGTNRRWQTIRGIGSVPEGNLAGIVSNSATNNADTVNFDGNGGLIFSNPNSSLGTSTTGDSITSFTVNGGVVYVGANDPANGSNGALGGSATAMTVGSQNTTANLGFMTYGSGAGIGASPTITTGRAVTVANFSEGSVTLGGFTDDYTSFSGPIVLNNTTTPTTFVAGNGGQVSFTGAISGAGPVVVGNATVEGDSSAAGIHLTNNNVIFAGTNTYTGSTSINAGTLTLSGTIGSGTGTAITSAATFTETSSGVIAGASTLTVTGGTTTLNGTNTYTGKTLVSGGVLNIAGGSTTFSTGSIVGTIPGQNAVLEITGGTLTDSDTVGLEIANAATSGAIGFVEMSGGTLISNNATGGRIRIGDINLGGTTAYAAFSMTGGTVNTTSSFALAQPGEYAVFNQSAGTVTAATTTNATFIANSAGSVAVMNLSGTASFTSTVGGVYVGGNAPSATTFGVLNVSGTASLTTANVGIEFGGTGNTGTGVVNLLGGTITTNIVQNDATSATFNFGGGTLKASAATATFMGGLTNAFVYSGGGTIDNGGNNITITQALLAPTGNGISATGLSVTGGSGYIDTPVVAITGGGGSGATAIATVAGGAVTGLTITNPGTGYTSVPTFTLAGGGGSGASIATGTAQVVANTSGGITFADSGAAATTTLTGVSTYSGPTIINSGTLALSNSSSNNIASSSSLRVAGGAGLNVAGLSGGTLTLGSGSAAQTLVGPTSGTSAATVTGNVTVVAPGTGIGGGTLSGGTTVAPLSITGTLTFQAGATASFTLPAAPNPSTPLVTTATLITPGSGNVTVDILNVPTTSIVAGTYDLLNWTSSGPGAASPAANFMLGTSPPSGITWTLFTTGTTSSGQLDLTVSSPPIVWTGRPGGDDTGTGTHDVWDINASTNWANGSSATTYAEGNNVNFGDSNPISVGNPPDGKVYIVNGGVNPSSVTFTNSAVAYSINPAGAPSGAGSGSIGGTGTTVTLNGGGTVTFNSQNTYTGSTTITSGSTLIISADNQLGNGTGAGNVVLNGGTLRVTGGGSIQLGASSPYRGIYLGPASGSGSGTLDAANGTQLSVPGAIVNNAGGTGNLIVASSGTGGGAVILTATNTYSGTTTINSGATLQIGNGVVPGALGSGDVTTNATYNPTTGLGGLIFDTGTSTTVTNNIGGSGSVTLIGGGTIVTLMPGTGNTYSGGTNIVKFTLKLGNNNALPSGTAVTLGALGANGTLDLNGHSATIGGLATDSNAVAGNQAILNNGGSAATLTFAGTGSPSTFGGTIQDGSAAVALAVTGGSLTITNNNNTYSGGTAVTGGTLVVDSPSTAQNSAIGTGTITVGDGTHAGSGTLTGNGFIGGSFQGSTVTIQNGGTIAGTSGNTLSILGTLNLISGSTVMATLNHSFSGNANALIAQSAVTSEMLNLSGTPAVTIGNTSSIQSGDSYDVLSYNTNAGITTSSFSLPSSFNGFTLTWSIQGSDQLDVSVSGSGGGGSNTPMNAVNYWSASPPANNLSFGATNNWSVQASNGYINIQSTIPSGIAPASGSPGGGGPFLTTDGTAGANPLYAAILAGTNSGTFTGGGAAVTMSWRARAKQETSPQEGGTPSSPPLQYVGSYLISNVLNLAGLGTSGASANYSSTTNTPYFGTPSVTEHETDPFVLQMNYNVPLLSNEAGQAKKGTIYLGWLAPAGLSSNGTLNLAAPTWQKADTGDFNGSGQQTGTLANGPDALANFQGTFAAFLTAENTAHPGLLSDDPTLNPANLSNTDLAALLGSYGVDTSGHDVWAVINHNSQFAVVPEPNALLLAALGLAGLAGYRARRRRK